MTKKPLAFGILAALMYALMLLVWGRNFTVQLIYVLLAMAAVMVGMRAIWLYGVDSLHGSSLRWILWGVGFWVIGEIVWLVSEWWLMVDPFPSWADGFYLAGYGLMYVGLYREISHVGISAIVKNKALFGLLTATAVILVGVVGYYGIYQALDPGASFWENSISLAYGVGDMLLVFGSFLILLMLREYKGGKLVNVFYPLAVGFLAILAGDVGFAMYYDEYIGHIRPYIYLDALWVAGYLMFLVAYYYVGKLAIDIQLKLPGEGVNHA
ncbi:hypothetical protein A3B57_01205 [Microgenomates group bacterium RIFCSPLOWO2_01_FULL_47_10]|nr:MAG: hypothetical protein A3B57_01205 [Microgenomates group bacterium RIFCSPLOWO2_01_FULL_47_10]